MVLQYVQFNEDSDSNPIHANYGFMTLAASTVHNYGYQISGCVDSELMCSANVTVRGKTKVWILIFCAMLCSFLSILFL